MFLDREEQGWLIRRREPRAVSLAIKALQQILQIVQQGGIEAGVVAARCIGDPGLPQAPGQLAVALDPAVVAAPGAYQFLQVPLQPGQLDGDQQQPVHVDLAAGIICLVVTTPGQDPQVAGLIDQTDGLASFGKLGAAQADQQHRSPVAGAGRHHVQLDPPVAKEGSEPGVQVGHRPVSLGCLQRSQEGRRYPTASTRLAHQPFPWCRRSGSALAAFRCGSVRVWLRVSA